MFSLEIEGILSPGIVQTEGGICEVRIMGEREVPDNVMVVFDLNGAEGEYLQVLCPVSYKMGEVQTSPVVSEVRYKQDG